MPDDKEKITAVIKFGPKASLRESTWNKFEQVNTESDAIELIVPAAHPTRWACISIAGWILVFTVVSKDRAIVLVITGCIPMKENIVIVSGVSNSINHEGKNAVSSKNK